LPWTEGFQQIPTQLHENLSDMIYVTEKFIYNEGGLQVPKQTYDFIHKAYPAA
jgi:hypothetical protein